MQRSWYELDRSNTGVIFYWVFLLQIYCYDVFSVLLVHKTHLKCCVEETRVRGKNLPLVWAETLFNDSEDVTSSPGISLEKLLPCHWEGKTRVPLTKQKEFHEMNWSLLQLQPNTHLVIHNIYLYINLSISMLHHRRRGEVVGVWLAISSCG